MGPLISQVGNYAGQLASKFISSPGGKYLVCKTLKQIWKKL